MQSITSAVGGMRLVYQIMFGWMILIMITGEMLRPVPRDAAASLQYGILICAASLMGIAVVVRQMTVAPAEQILRLDPGDAASINRWRTGQLISWALTESVALFGFGLRSLGLSLGRALPLYGAAIILMVLFRPNDPQS